MGQDLGIIYKPLQPNMPDLDGLRADTQGLVAIGLLCGLSLLLTMLWLLVVWEYIRRAKTRASDLEIGVRKRPTPARNSDPPKACYTPSLRGGKGVGKGDRALVEAAPDNGAGNAD
jgi:hypothetical protein